MGPSLYSALKLARSLAEQTGGGGAAATGGGGSRAGGTGSYFSLGQIACIAADCFEALGPSRHRLAA